ncbi:hypothetical protein [Mycobacterium sp. IDR2000157661]|uniref:hypothetical protein n=1 Tax=Mycobacterium sp. IDR2000157661 TaxID=2867005 RepID=UPI001EEAD45E|nr:hypothetical protein [Mycobacterium sp. IDR2000157661]ULE33271.1 hypothetical protein K3G64_25065 [Mycobacterium sp. IDR2000157661]
MTTEASTTRRVTRYLAGPALALGVAIGSAAGATAEPVWDVVAWDSCVRAIPDDVLLGEYGDDALRECCWKTGGDWKPDGHGTACKAPPPGQSGRNPLTSAPTHVMQPAPLPAPPGDIGPTTGGVG